MKTSWIYIFAAFFLVVIFIYTFGNSEENYKSKIEDQREEYEFGLRNAENSPLEDKATFTGLAFYPPSIDAIVEADLELIEEIKTVSLVTNTQSNRTYRFYGKLTFNVNETEQTLMLLQNMEDETDFFLPFFDETNGETTYGGGRYLPIEMTRSKKIVLDFNLAFNPYCTYNKEYICPIPPKENKLSVKIEAGEKHKASYYEN